jgi:hypothetical protein
MIARLNPKRTTPSDPIAILGLLSQMQFVRPHQPLQEALSTVQEQIGICRAVVERAVRWLELDESLAIGRLRRGELAQLSECMHRFWRRVAPVPAGSQR